MGTVTIFNRDCIEGMSQLDQSSIDLIIADPPFAIDFKPQRQNYNRAEGRVLNGYVDVPCDDYESFSNEWISQATRVLKTEGSMYIFSGWTHLRHILNAIEAAGLTTVNHIIWQYQFGVYTKRRYVSSHYHILYVCKNDAKRQFYLDCRFREDDIDSNGKKSAYHDRQDVWNIPREYWRGEVKTPTKLPGEIIRKIIGYSSKEEDTILDPFMGSGQTAVIGLEMNRNVIGFEIVKEYYDFILSRLP